MDEYPHGAPGFKGGRKCPSGEKTKIEISCTKECDSGREKKNVISGQWPASRFLTGIGHSQNLAPSQRHFN